VFSKTSGGCTNGTNSESVSHTGLIILSREVVYIAQCGLLIHSL